MRGKSIVLLLFALASFVSAFGVDYKVVDRSEKKLPEWLHTLPEGNILIEVERPNLGEAQSAAEQELRKRIISSVATNVFHRTSESASESRENDVHNFMEKFEMETETASATLPFLSGISLSKAKGTYWEKREDKKSKRTYVVFSALYPMTDEEIIVMTAEFERNDRAKNEELKALREGLANVESSIEIEDAAGRLEALKAYFFDKVRKADAESLYKSYTGLYKGLTMSGSFSRGNLIIRVKLNGRPFKVSARPNLKSNCASGLRPEHSADGKTITIHYNSDDCLPDEENWIDVQLRIKNANLHEKFLIP